MGGKLTKFRGQEVITENHESFYPRKFLVVRYMREADCRMFDHADSITDYYYYLLLLRKLLIASYSITAPWRCMELKVRLI